MPSHISHKTWLPRPYTPKNWLDLYRSLLRECSYLPDPIARDYSHSQVVRRFRRYDRRTPPKDKYNLLWQSAHRKTALRGLSLLKRANVGYSKPLEKVLRLAYGRIGPRRRDLVATTIAPEVPADNLIVAEMMKKPTMFEDGWEPPEIVVNLLKSQDSNATISRLGVLQKVKTFEPPIPKTNSWGKEVSKRRRRNIRQRWYNSALQSLFPPLPDPDLKILDGLISGSVPWEPVKRRTPVGTWPTPLENLSDFLEGGPKKGHTFRAWASGRPHNITHRFMRRLWQRISSLVPRLEWSEEAQRHRFHWDTMKKEGNVSYRVESGESHDLFKNSA